MKSLLLLSAAFCLVAASCTTSGGSPSNAGNGSESGTASSVVPVKTAPIAYFDEHCASCHGPGGQNYGSTFGQNLSDSELTKTVKEMAEGQGQAPLDTEGVGVETAYHRALILKQPFLAWTGSEGHILKGEVTPDATVTAKSGGQDLPVKMTGKTAFTVELGSTRPESVSLQAKKGEAVTELDLANSSYSHSEPLIKK